MVVENIGFSHHSAGLAHYRPRLGGRVGWAGDNTVELRLKYRSASIIISELRKFARASCNHDDR
jgi:hypothetical protein